MLNTGSLKNCHKVISTICRKELLWVPKRNLCTQLSFYDGRTPIPPEAVHGLIKTHDDFHEYLSVIDQGITEYLPKESLVSCNDVWNSTRADKYIKQSLTKSNIPFEIAIEPVRYVKYRILAGRLKSSENNRMYDYWKELYDFSKDEIDSFNHAYLRFHERLIAIMYGYISGELRIAYANGADSISKYKILLKQLAEIESEFVFKYVFDGSRKLITDLEWDLMIADNVSEFIVTNRNDETLSERALVTELLKVFMEYGEGNCVSAVYRFTRSAFIENDIERKTIQRCWESLCKAVEARDSARSAYVQEAKR